MTRAQQERFVERVGKDLMRLFDMQHYTLKYTFRYEEKNHASASWDPEYSRGCVNVNLDGDEDYTDEALLKLIIHEHVHAPVFPLRKLAMSLTEGRSDEKLLSDIVYETDDAVVSTFERALFKLLKDKYLE